MKPVKVCLLLLAISIALASCSVLRKKDKHKVITQIDSAVTKSSYSTRIDTSSYESHQRITFEFPSGYFDQGNYHDYAALAAQMIEATRNLANKTQAVASGKDLKPAAAAAPAKANPGLKATLETWEKGKKGISETTDQKEQTELKKDQKQVDTKSETKRYPLFTVIAWIAGTIAFLVALYYIIRRRK